MKSDFDLDFFVNDIATLGQHVTTDFAGATRERDATHRILENFQEKDNFQEKLDFIWQ